MVGSAEATAPFCKVTAIVRVDLLERVEERLEAHTGSAGDGIVVVLPVEAVYRIRTRALEASPRGPGAGSEV